MPKRKKAFDCVELQDRGALAIYERTKDMTREEELAHWSERSAELRREQEELRRKSAASTVEPRGTNEPLSPVSPLQRHIVDVENSLVFGQADEAEPAQSLEALA